MTTARSGAKRFLSTLPQNILGCFQGKLVLWHLLAIGLTVILVLSGFDWKYFRGTREITVHSWWWPALPIGMFLPVLFPFGLIIGGRLARRAELSLLGWAIGQAAFVGWLISSFYKSLTGRSHPAHDASADITRAFKFGLLRGGVFWGWPSSHTAVAFAMAAAFAAFFPKHRAARWIAFAYAFYIGISVSLSIHWLSDFVAGAIVGTVAGTVVGRSFSAPEVSQTDLSPFQKEAT